MKLQQVIEICEAYAEFRRAEKRLGEIAGRTLQDDLRGKQQ